MSRRNPVGRLAAAALAASLALAQPTRAQGWGVPVDASVLAAPVLLLLVIPVVLYASTSDQPRVRELERRADWEGLATLASARLAQHPGDIDWLEIRGRARQRQGRCDVAISDLGPAFEARLAVARPVPDLLYQLGMALGLCQLAAGQPDAARRSFLQTAERVPGRWEPGYYLGVAQLQLGDLDAATASAAALQGRNAEMAQALESRILAARHPAPPSVVVEPARAPMAVPLLEVATRSLGLPAGRWWSAPSTEQVVRGRYRRQYPQNEIQTRLATARAYQVGRQGLTVAVALQATVQRTDALFWSLDNPCGGTGWLYLEQFGTPADQPECLSLRRVDLPRMLASPELAPIVRGAVADGVAAPSDGLEVRYLRYAAGRAVGVTVLLAPHDPVSEALALPWAIGLVRVLRPLADDLPSASAQLNPF